MTLDDYRSLRVIGSGRGWQARHSDKGHLAELEALAEAVHSSGRWPISLEEQTQAMRVSFAVERQLTERA